MAKLKGEYNVEEVLARLKKNRVRVQGRRIVLPKHTGLKLRGYIDFLCNHCGFNAVTSIQKEK